MSIEYTYMKKCAESRRQQITSEVTLLQHFLVDIFYIKKFTHVSYHSQKEETLSVHHNSMKTKTFRIM